MKIIKDFDSFINEAETATVGGPELDQLFTKEPSELQFFSEPKTANKPQVIGVNGTVKDQAGKPKNISLKYKIEASYGKYSFPVKLANVKTAKQPGVNWGAGSITGFAKPYPDNTALHATIMAFVPKKDKGVDVKYSECEANEDYKGKIKLSDGTYVFPSGEASWYNVGGQVGDWMFFWVNQKDMKNALGVLKSKKGASAVIETPSKVKLTLTRV